MVKKEIWILLRKVVSQCQCRSCLAAMKPHEIQEKLGLTRISDRWVVL